MVTTYCISITLSQTSPGFYVSAVHVFKKRYGNRRNEQFLRFPQYFLPSQSVLKYGLCGKKLNTIPFLKQILFSYSLESEFGQNWCVCVCVCVCISISIYLSIYLSLSLSLSLSQKMPKTKEGVYQSDQNLHSDF